MPRSTSTASWRSASPPRHSTAAVTAVIAAAGSGERLGAGGPKAFVPLAGKPMIEWSLDAFRACESVRAIAVAIPPGSDDAFAGQADVGIVWGGATRAQSVANALGSVDTALVAIHDAARPLLTPELIEALVGRLEEVPEAAGVIAATPVTDTIKQAADRRSYGGSSDALSSPGMQNPSLAIEQTVDRRRLWAAQTPQVFRTAALREALAVDSGSRDAATDEAMLVEQAGGTVLLHPASPDNLKVTTPLDLQVAEALLSPASAPRPGWPRR